MMWVWVRVQEDPFLSNMEEDRPHKIISKWLSEETNKDCKWSVIHEESGTLRKLWVKGYSSRVGGSLTQTWFLWGGSWHGKAENFNINRVDTNLTLRVQPDSSVSILEEHSQRFIPPFVCLRCCSLSSTSTAAGRCSWKAASLVRSAATSCCWPSCYSRTHWARWRPRRAPPCCPVWSSRRTRRWSRTLPTRCRRWGGSVCLCSGRFSHENTEETKWHQPWRLCPDILVQPPPSVTHSHVTLTLCRCRSEA